MSKKYLILFTRSIVFSSFRSTVHKILLHICLRVHALIINRMTFLVDITVILDHDPSVFSE